MKRQLENTTSTASATMQIKKKKRKKTAVPVKPLAHRSKLPGYLPAVLKKRSREEIIREYHTLQKKLELATTAEARKSVLKEIDDLGGLDAYQEASILGHSSKQHDGFNTSKWIVPLLKAHFQERKTKLELLDVGALTNHYLHHTEWLQCLPIDLHPRHPSVKQMDFFALNPVQHRFDAIVLSLVLNFVGDRKKRGEMLLRARDMLDVGSLLFLVLPSACVTNSRYLTEESLVAALQSIGFVLLFRRLSKKLILLGLKRVEQINPTFRLKPKATIAGAKRNNFSIEFTARC